MIEYVPSVSLARVLAEHRTIHRFLLLHNEDPEGWRRPTACPPVQGASGSAHTLHHPRGSEPSTWQRAIDCFTIDCGASMQPLPVLLASTVDTEPAVSAGPTGFFVNRSTNQPSQKLHFDDQAGSVASLQVFIMREPFAFPLPDYPRLPRIDRLTTRLERTCIALCPLTAGASLAPPGERWQSGVRVCRAGGTQAGGAGHVCEELRGVLCDDVHPGGGRPSPGQPHAVPRRPPVPHRLRLHSGWAPGPLRPSFPRTIPTVCRSLGALHGCDLDAPGVMMCCPLMTCPMVSTDMVSASRSSTVFGGSGIAGARILPYIRRCRTITETGSTGGCHHHRDPGELIYTSSSADPSTQVSHQNVQVIT